LFRSPNQQQRIGLTQLVSHLPFLFRKYPLRHFHPELESPIAYRKHRGILGLATNQI
ncbi:hypothetical protein VN97_g10280, partial [Penicillium thymicola]